MRGLPTRSRFGLALCLSGVVSAMSGCAMMGAMRPAADSYTYDIGVGTAADIRARTSTMLKNLGYDIVRDDGKDNLFLETEWKDREAMDGQERRRGSHFVSRVQVTGSPQHVAGAPVMYHALVTIENRFVPAHGTRRDALDLSSATSYASTIVKGLALAIGGTATPVGDDLHPF